MAPQHPQPTPEHSPQHLHPSFDLQAPAQPPRQPPPRPPDLPAPLSPASTLPSSSPRPTTIAAALRPTSFDPLCLRPPPSQSRNHHLRQPDLPPLPSPSCATADPSSAPPWTPAPTGDSDPDLPSLAQPPLLFPPSPRQAAAAATKHPDLFLPHELRPTISRAPPPSLDQPPLLEQHPTRALLLLSSDVRWSSTTSASPHNSKLEPPPPRCEPSAAVNYYSTIRTLDVNCLTLSVQSFSLGLASL